MRFPRILFSSLLLLACGVEDPSGLDEPFRVLGGQFIEGEIPSSVGRADTFPRITSFEMENAVVLPSQGSKGIRGRVSMDAEAVAIRFKDMGSGYWVVPTGAPDPQYQGERSWSVRVDFPKALPPGLHSISAAGISGSKDVGQTLERDICAASSIPDNLHGCDPSNSPPAAVFSLGWSADADVDLEIISSTGDVANPSHPLLVPVDAGKRPDANAARIDRDSLEGCRPDGLRRENFILQERPKPGSWFRVHAKLADACGHSSVSFQLRVLESRGEGAGIEIIETFSESGILNAGEAGDPVGLLVAEIRF